MAVVREIRTVAGAALPVYEGFTVRRCRYAPEDGASAGRVCLVTGVHGDETLGQLILFETARRIMAQPECLRGIVDMYPMLNPLGLDIGERMVPVGTRLDMNRTFPGNPDGTPLERICSQLMQDMQGADLVLDVHSSAGAKNELLQVRVMAEESPSLMEKAHALSPDLIWIYPDQIAREASLSGALCAAGTPALMMQADDTGSGVRAAAERAAEGILRCMKRLGIFTGDTDAAPETPVPVIRGEGEAVRLTCTKPGMYVPEDCLGRRVKAGQRLGVIADALEGTVVEEILAPAAGLVFSRRVYSMVYPGSLIARVYCAERRNEA